MKRRTRPGHVPSRTAARGSSARRGQGLDAAAVETHVVRIGRLDADHLPTPAHLERFRLGKVNQAEFFAWAQEGIMRLEGRKPPRGETWVVRSRIPSDTETAAWRFEQNQAEPDIEPQIAALAAEWTAEAPHGWPEIDAIVRHLRDEYTHDPAARPADDGDDPLRWFLFESRRGPDYLFATAAALLLRARGYSMRVAGGLYVRPERDDAATGHTVVLAEDLHSWPEVRSALGEWVVLEPTPGYEVLQPRPGLGGLLAMAGRWAWSHAPLLGGAVLVALALAWTRRRWTDWLLTAWWRATLPRAPRAMLLHTLWLLERRARLAHRERPVGLTPQRWLAQLTETAEQGQPRRAARRQPAGGIQHRRADAAPLAWTSCWQRFLWWSSWAAFAPPDSAAVAPVAELRVDCLEIVSRWTYYRMHRLARNSA